MEVKDLRMKKYNYKMKLKLTLSLLIAILIGCSQQQPQKPNIIFILADDLGYSQIECNGSSYYKTPNINKIAEEGMRFTNAYTAAAICSPTRASIMTGKYPAKLHLTDFIPGNKKVHPLEEPEWQKHLPLEETTIAEEAKKAGYSTAIFGKWHLSSHKKEPESLPFNPDKQGFDEHFVTFKPGVDKTREWQKPELDGHNVDTITSRSLDFIKRNKNNPFFLIVSHNTIHGPLMECAETINQYSNPEDIAKPENHPVLGAMVDRLDRSIGKILSGLDKAGISDNTIVIFFSDNGGLERDAKQTPFRSGKGWLYEGGIRVPLIVKWPGKIDKGVISDATITSTDFFPTFKEIWKDGQCEKEIDGRSFLKVLLDKNQTGHDTIFWHYPHYHGSGMMPAAAVRAGNYKLIEWYEQSLLTENSGIELFDLKSDPGENNNLTSKMPDKANELLQILHDWQKSAGAQMPNTK
jgi:uncharacterized sulfatase